MMVRFIRACTFGIPLRDQSGEPLTDKDGNQKVERREAEIGDEHDVPADYAAQLFKSGAAIRADLAAKTEQIAAEIEAQAFAPAPATGTTNVRVEGGDGEPTGRGGLSGLVS